MRVCLQYYLILYLCASGDGNKTFSMLINSDIQNSVRYKPILGLLNTASSEQLEDLLSRKNGSVLISNASQSELYVVINGSYKLIKKGNLTLSDLFRSHKKYRNIL